MKYRFNRKFKYGLSPSQRAAIAYGASVSEVVPKKKKKEKKDAYTENHELL